MKANEFVENHGWEYAKGIIIACESGFLPKNQNYDDLKRLIESHELVEKHGGLKSVKIQNSGEFMLSDLIPEITQAIADVESCHVD